MSHAKITAFPGDRSMRPRIYTDTSVIGGCLDAEFRQPSLRLLELFRSGAAMLVLSDLTQLELEDSPAAVREVLARVPRSSIERVDLTEEAFDLARRYIAERVIHRSKRADAEHIAIATIARVDVLVSWNFRHIVNLERIRGYNSVNLRHGYPLLEIRSPWEVVRHEGS